MKISLKWLNDYIDLSGISTDEIVDKLTISGLEVDEVIDKRKEFDKIVVGFVKEKKKHPNADKLSVCVVSDGENDFNVVCGAPNVDAGQKVAFAKVGALLPGMKIKLKKTKIRGEVSEGMICAEDELGLGDDHTGIVVLNENLQEGISFAKAIGIDDVMIDIDITPNRADALSFIGIARDLSVLLNRKFKMPALDLKISDKSISDFASVEIKNNVGCPRYSAVVVNNVTVEESPNWLKEKLSSIGLRPINNIVDVTNFILYELGQPLHAFDLDKLAGRKIIVRNAEDGEKFITLDLKERKLKPEDLMICDSKKAVAIAGIMGGENSEVTNSTKNILIESAYFNPSTVRKTSKRLGLSTDASYRFERGCNVDMTIFAAQRAAQLIAGLSNGKVAEGVIDVYPDPIQKKNVKLRFERVEKILGVKVSDEEIKKILIGLEFKVKEETSKFILVEVPLFRHDIEREIDLIEEVARIYGYNRIPSAEKIKVTLASRVDHFEHYNVLREILNSLGYYEIITNSLLSDFKAKEFGNAIEVLNPQTVEMSHLRTSLIPGALITISKNLKVRQKNLKLFELGHTFIKKNVDKIESFDSFIENKHLLIVLTGNAQEDEWYGKKRAFDIYDLKGDVDEFIRKNYLNTQIKNIDNSFDKKYFEYGFSKEYRKTIVATGGKLKKEILEKYDIDQNVFIFDFNISKVENIKKKARKFHSLLKYPKVYRDFAFVVDKTISNEEVIKAIYEGSSNLLKNIKLFDIFESESIGIDKKSVAYQLEYFNETGTLTEEEVDKDFWNAIENVKKKLNAQLRG